MFKTYKRVEIREGSNNGLFLVIGEYRDDAWHFSGRSTWECAWYPVSATEARIANAEQLSNGQKEKVDG